MKNIINIVLLSPILIYVLLLFINIEILKFEQKINIFWIWEINIAIIAFISIFFILYIFLMYFSWKFFTFFIAVKNKSLEQEKIKLKSQLSDKIPQIEEKMQQKFDETISEIKKINNKNLELYKKENSKIIWKLEFEIQNLKNNLKK